MQHNPYYNILLTYQKIVSRQNFLQKENQTAHRIEQEAQL